MDIRSTHFKYNLQTRLAGRERIRHWWDVGVQERNNFFKSMSMASVSFRCDLVRFVSEFSYFPEMEPRNDDFD